MTNNLPESQIPTPQAPLGYGQQFPAPNGATMPARYEPVAVAVLPEYDEVTPGEPAEYLVPAEYRRPFGEAPRDKRGKFWTIAFASALSAAASFIVIFTPFALYGINVVAALAAVILGIRALVIISNSPITSFSGKAKIYSWLGVAGGALNLILTVLAVVGIIALFSFIENESSCSVFGTEQDSYQCEVNSTL